MATKTFEELKQLAIQIRDEKTNKQNTATRIGTQMLEHLDKLEQDYYDKTATDEELKERDEKLTEIDYLKPELQKALTFKEIPFISLDSSSSATNNLHPNNSETSLFVGVICKPLRNAKYKYSSWPFGQSYIRYYKGKVNTDAKCVYNDTVSMSTRKEFNTPDVDFDFAVINLQKPSEDEPLYYPINSFYALNINTEDIEDGAVTTDKLEDGAVTTDKLEGLNLFEYCLNACNGFVPNLNAFTNLTTDEDAWTKGLLKNNGEVDTEIEAGGPYQTSKFVDYDAPYGQPYSVLYANMGPENYSNPYVQVAFYKKDDHSFVKAFQCVGYKRLILIPRGYSIRVSNKMGDDSSLYFSAYISSLKTIEATVNDVQSSVTNLTNVVNEVKETTDIITNDATIDTETYTDEVNPSTDNVKIFNNQIWTNSGNLIDAGDFSTFRLVIPSGATSVNLSNYNTGVFNGGFFTENETWIKGINNSLDSMSDVEIPIGAYYIDVTYRNSTSNTMVVIFNFERKSYNLPNIRLNASQINGNVVKNNQWFGKKLCIIGTSVAYGSNAEAAYAKIASERLGFEIVPAGVPGLAIHAKIDEEHGSVLAPLTYGSTCLSKAEYEAAKEAGATNTTIPDTPLPTSGESWSPGSGSYNSYYRTWENVFSEENKDVALWIYAVAPNNSNFDTTDWDNFNKTGWVYNDGKPFEEHRTTFLGALLYLMDKMYTLNPNSRMVFCLDSAFNYEQGKESLKKLSEQWNIPIIDLWGKINTTPKSLKVLKSKNGTDNHPSTFGQERLGDIFTNELLLIS